MSSDTNNVVLVGRLVRDAEVKYTSTGKSLCLFSIAVNEDYVTDGQKTTSASYFDVVLWGKIVEAIGKYLTKGKQVIVTGKLKQDRWKDERGNVRSKVKINCQNIQLLGSKNEGQAQQRQSVQSIDNFSDEIPF